MSYTRRITRLVEKTGFAVSKAILVLMMVLITANTVGRYVFNMPVPGVISLTERYLMIGVVFLSAAAVQREGKNVSVDLFEDKFPKPIRHLLMLTTRAIVIVILLFIVVESAGIAMDRLQSGASTTGNLPLPTGPSWGMVTIGLTVLCVVLLDQLIENIRYLHGYATGSQERVLSTTSDSTSGEEKS